MYDEINTYMSCVIIKEDSYYLHTTILTFRAHKTTISCWWCELRRIVYYDFYDCKGNLRQGSVDTLLNYLKLFGKTNKLIIYRMNIKL
jgi:hypothetical protein